MTLFLDDGDVRLYHGDALETVRTLEDESVDCVVTSPPYWGLRDYGIDGQMGLEESPDEFVAGMVELFHEIRRVVAPHGTCWVNLGDSYATSGGNDRNGSSDGAVGRGDRPDERLRAGLKPKDLVGIPWRVAFALQADGWWLRSDIIWAKPNPMPESVTDRPTKSHEYVFLLTKQPRYWFDTEAVREPLLPSSIARGEYGHASFGKGQFNGSPTDERHQEGKQVRKVSDLQNPAGRNVRSVWQIATQPYPEAHFATYPEELARRCILAGCPVRVCRVCGKPSERIVERERPTTRDARVERLARIQIERDQIGSGGTSSTTFGIPAADLPAPVTVGWSDCGCSSLGPTEAGEERNVAAASAAENGVGGTKAGASEKWRPGVVLDPFIGSGTTAKVARDHQRHAIGIDLNQEYLELAARRLQQLSLLNAT